MTIAVRSIALLLLASGAAHAGGPTVPNDPAPAPAAAAPSAYDWSGPYMGLAVGTTGGDQTFNTSPNTFPFENGAVPSIYAGYLFQRGNVVYGAELAFSNGNDANLSGGFLEKLRSLIDLKGRLGFANDRALFYGTLGYSSVGYESLPGETDTDGLVYGLGVDYAVSDRFTVGLEYLARSTEGDTFNAGETRKLDLNSVSLRIGLSF
jgi:opacity protein-like surface antigen